MAKEVSGRWVRKGGEERAEGEGEGEGEETKGGSEGETEEKGQGEAGKKAETDTRKKSDGETTVKEKETHTSLKLTGLRDWSSAIFGDPLLATIFSDPLQQPPSPHFLEGFNGEEPDPDPNPRHLPPNLGYPLDRTIIEDIDTAWIRLLFYQIYHAVARIVTEFYRPRQDSSARELEGRRKLNEVLARLAEVPDDAKKRHQRPSGEMSPAKRVRGGEDG